MAGNINYNSYWGYYGIKWNNASGNSDIIYSGKSSNGNLYRSRIVLNTDGMIISSSSKLVVKITVAQQDSQIYDSTVARLSTYNLANPGDYFKDDGYTPIDKITSSTISQSRVYTNSAGTSLASSEQAEGDVLYLVFDTKNKIKAGEKYYIYIGREGTSSSRFNAFKASEINLTYESYTKCGAPTSVSLNKEYVAPNENFTVSWGAGTGGNANDISGYHIYYKLNPSASSVSYPSTSDNYFVVGKDTRSYTISASKITDDDIRGYHITFAVRTVGWLGPTYDSDLTNSTDKITINTLPETDSMTVSASKSILPSTGGMVTFNLSGATDDHHSVSYAYATSATGTKNPISGSNVSLNISKDTTVYFWAYDGLEYSAGNKSIDIKVNTKPTCNISLESGDIEDTDSVVPSGYNYILSPTFSARKDNTTLGNNNSFSYYYRIYNNNPKETDPIEGSYGSGESLSITDVRSVFSISPPFYYCFGAMVNDGIEESEKAWGDLYYVTGAPAIKNIYNTSDSNNVEGMGSYGSQDFYFSKQLCFDFVYDAGYEGKNFSLNNSSKSAQVKKLINERTLRAFFSDCGIAAPGEHKLSGYFLNKTDCSCQASRAMYRIKPFEIKNLQVTNCKPYTNNNIAVTIASNNLDFYLESSANPKEFGINKDHVKDILSFSGALKYQNKTIDLGALSISSSNATMTFKSFSYNDKDKKFNLDIDGTHEVDFVLKFINSFGDETEKTKEFVINYKETPEIAGVSITLPNEGVDYVKQDQPIKFYVQYGNCYNSSQKLKIESQYGSETYENIISGVSGGVEIYVTVPKILSSKELSDLTFSITNKAETNISKTINKKIVFLKHDTPNVVLTRTDYSESDSSGTSESGTPEGDITKGDLIVYFSPSDWGLDSVLQAENITTIELTLCRPETEKELELDTKFFTYNANLTSCLFENIAIDNTKDWQTQEIYLKITVTSNIPVETIDPDTGESILKGKSTHTQITNTILVYNSTPTVAYRKNQLGINTKDPTGREEALVVIGGASGRNQIFYETNQDKPYCQVINFQFNGGVWGSDLDNDDIGVIVDNLPSAEQNSF